MTEIIKKGKYFHGSALQVTLIVLSAVMILLYILTFSHMHDYMGESGGVIVLIPVVLSAWALGARVGMFAGLIVGLINFFLHGFTLQNGYLESVFIIFSIVIAVLIGWVTGKFSELRISSLLFGVDLDADAGRHKIADLLRKRTREMIARERNLLRTLIDNIPDKVYVKDSIGRYIINNVVHLQSLGLSKQEETSGKTVYDFFPEEFARRFAADEQSIVDTGEPLLNREEEVIDSKTGKINWHLTTKVPIRDEHNRIIGIAGISRDITKRKQAEEAVRQSEERFRAVVEQSADAIYITDPESLHVINSNHAFQKMLGYSQEESHLLPLERIVAAPFEEIKKKHRSYYCKSSINLGRVAIPKKRRLYYRCCYFGKCGDIRRETIGLHICPRYH